MQLAIDNLTVSDQQEIQRLLGLAQHDAMAVTDLWRIMDIVWDEIGCDSANLEREKISAYYSHPVWTLNGLFIEQDEESMGHRRAIADWIVAHGVSRVLDYGGGFGTLARIIAAKSQGITVDIHEPFPSQLAISKVSEFSNIRFVNALAQDYDCLVCIDVLEHVPNPLELFATMIQSVKVDGFLIVANCFYPDIKCHLPSTFHFRHTFNFFARAMGLQVIGLCQDSHAMIYRRPVEKEIDWSLIHRLEKLSKLTSPVNQALGFNIKRLKNLTKSMIGRQNTATLRSRL
jgi:2-polyprenyl-3-methyl-5-hydroxy-6-metoxy-1,4-benzoquinol methylase